MALPSSGQITLAQIRDVFGAGTTSNVSLRTLSAAAGLSTPDAFSEFYGLSASPITSLSSRQGFLEETGFDDHLYTPQTLTYVSGSGAEGDPIIYDIELGRIRIFAGFSFINIRYFDLTFLLNQTISQFDASQAEFRFIVYSRQVNQTLTIENGFETTEGNFQRATSFNLFGSQSLPYYYPWTRNGLNTSSQGDEFYVGGDTNNPETIRIGVEFRNY